MQPDSFRTTLHFPFFFALRWVEHYSQKPSSWHSKSGYVAVGLILASYFTRTVGLTLFATTIAYLIAEVNLPRSQENLKKVLVIAIVLITVSLQHHLSQPEYPSKLRQGLSYEREIFSLKPGAPNALRIGWQDLAERVNGNAKYYQALIANIVLGKNKRVHPEKPRIKARGKI